MNEMIILTSFGVLIIAVIVGIVSSHKMMKILKERHKEIWEDLGKPTMFLYNSISNNLSVNKYLRKKEYEKTNDTEFISICNFNRIYTNFYFVLFGIVLIIFYPKYCRTFYEGVSNQAVHWNAYQQ